MEFGEDKSKDIDIHGELRFGTAEVPKLSNLNNKITLLEQKQEKIKGKLKYTAVVGKSLTGKTIRQIRKNRLIFPGEKVIYDNGGKRYHRFFKKFDNGGKRHRHFFKETERETATGKDYENYLNSKDNMRLRKRNIRRGVYYLGKKFIDDESIGEDENVAELKRKGKLYFRVTRRGLERNIRNIKLKNNNYTRLKFMEDKQQLLQMKKDRLLNKSIRQGYRNQIGSASSRYQKRMLKKEMASAVRIAEGNWVIRTKNQFILKKKSIQQKARMIKRVVGTLLSSLSLLFFFLALLGMGLILLMALVGGFGEYTEMAVTQNDYATLSDSTAYLKKQETDLEEYLQKKSELEAEIETSYGPDLYEYIYDFADTGFSSTTLMAYLSAKYGTFTLDMVQAEIDSLFQEMYNLEIEVVEELREVSYQNPDTGEIVVVEELKKVCYITLHKKELEEVVEGRMSAEEKERYSNYKLSSGGQQVYGPVMLEDWTNLISSDYGERIHPVTGERTFHNGIDIAIPTGTKLYSAVQGTVLVAQYSETAGNYIRVQTDSGWVVTFMHMDTLAVTAGQKIEKGDFVGHSGNTGRSTGPHLHLEVRDSNNNTVNPIFIVPQNCYQEESSNT